jgi:hypothetical protein
MIEPTKTTREAVEEFNRFARQLKTVIELAAHVESFENVERRAAEANSRAIAAEQREAAAKQSADAAEKRFATDEERRRAHADKVVADAETRARRIRADADAYADGLRLDAENVAAGIRKVADADARAASEQASKWRSEADNIQGAINGKRDELAMLERQITEARAVITKLMGA